MANRFASAMESGFAIGQSTGGRFSGFGGAIKGIADELRSEREFGRELEGKKSLLGETARLKPTSQSIVSRTGEVVGERPAGSIFAPKEKSLSKDEREIIGGIRSLKSQGRDGEIIDFVSFSGFNPEDFAEEIGELKPTAPKKSFLKKIQDVFSR